VVLALPPNIRRPEFVDEGTWGTSGVAVPTGQVGKGSKEMAPSQSKEVDIKALYCAGPQEKRNVLLSSI
jgi:hypothetical protein